VNIDFEDLKSMKSHPITF